MNPREIVIDRLTRALAEINVAAEAAKKIGVDEAAELTQLAFGTDCYLTAWKTSQPRGAERTAASARHTVGSIPPLGSPKSPL